MAQEARRVLDQDTDSTTELGDFSCIEFRIHSMGTIYLSRLWQTSGQETCFLIKEGSAVLAHLAVGDEIDARFLHGGSGGAPRQMAIHIQDIRLETTGRFKGHHLIVLTRSGHRPALH